MKIRLSTLSSSLFSEARSAPRLVLRFVLISLVATSLSRILLSVTYRERIASFSDWLTIMAQGVRIDVVLLCYVFSIPLLLSLFLAKNKLSRLVFVLIKAWLVLGLSLIVFLELVTPEFILEYDLRPNRIFIDYLIYPREVFSMLWTGYKPAIFFALSGLIIVMTLTFKIVRGSQQSDSGHSLLKGALLFLVLFPALIAGARSSLQHRPINPSMVYFSSDNLVNSLILNSSYSVLVDLYNLGGEESAQDLYGSMPENEIIQQVRESTSSHISDFVSDNSPTLAYHSATHRGSKKNIVIILQESLGTRYVGGLGGLPLTPNIDELIKEGWNLSNLYATGTRSVRGIEAIVTGFSPSPSRSVVKLSKSQHDFFSIASFLQEKGYHTQFIYGGESHFDNMKSFFLGNGFEEIKDLATFDHPKFIGSWGASDEDLFNQADIELSRLSSREQPFFSLIFTASNHSPYDFPEGCTELYNSPAATRENAVKYADCALGKFVRKAKTASYWKNTIFLVIADHDSRISSASVFPIEHFKIPAIIFGENIAPRQDQRLSSQLDIPPTLLSLAGVEGFHPMIGHDLSRSVEPSQQRAIMQYGTDFAWMNRNHAIILRANEPARIYLHDGHTLGPQVDEIDSKMLAKARANALWANLAYKKGFYSYSNKVPPVLVTQGHY